MKLKLLSLLLSAGLLTGCASDGNVSNKRYLRAKVVSTFTDGKMTVGLVNDDDIPWNQK